MIEKKSRSKKMVEERKQMGTCYLFLIREGDEEALRQKQQSNISSKIDMRRW